MNNFTYYNPTKIEFGKEKENNIGEYLGQSGIQKVLKSFKQLQLLQMMMRNFQMKS